MATQRNESEGSTSSAAADSRSAGDLKQREYRDAQGNVHHHTRSYLERHAGRSLTRGRRRGSAARTEDASRSDEVSAEAAQAETEETTDDVEIEIHTLVALAQMDSEAAAAYDAAAELVEASDVRSQLEQFADDHRRHISDLGRIIEELGGSVRAAAAPPPENSTFVMFATALGAIGTQGALLSLINSEQLTNANYELAVELMDDPQHRAVLERNFADEQRHITWLTEQARELGDVTDPTEEELDASDDRA